ncbi:Penicillin-binding protein 1F [Pseudovibrio axinellae]|uniref:Biosynthetic peptidoglycan transglycosylase n=1 Tax=Pseudovibrio axinellae TaxID=989403 RepID=A0A166AZ75_9HYPH|nr:monofunctional biosynthetic peptidoglycan transglycosylase [Pseudovibrio axinellae]KZL21741.1 Penicillin-binding protein 1F [Pseudovibrio axinellae]SEQ21618.1 monofunctional biosynthetic peptidoglycan transglycosylase [Pseudovibrio axinellae]
MKKARLKEKPEPLKRRIRRWLLGALGVIVALPVVLTLLYSVVPPYSSLMLYRSVTGQPVWREWVPLEQITVNLQRSVVVSEDAKFCQNFGVDWSAVQGQVEKLMAGKRPRGASTITMQLAKNLFLWNGRDYVRKALEVPLAFMLDAILSKRRILEIYLNVAEWGPGIFGVEAASQTFFGKSAAKLSLSQAALLATALPNPVARNPAKPSSGHRRLASINRSRAQVAGDVLSCISATER